MFVSLTILIKNISYRLFMTDLLEHLILEYNNLLKKQKKVIVIVNIDSTYFNLDWDTDFVILKVTFSQTYV